LISTAARHAPAADASKRSVSSAILNVEEERLGVSTTLQASLEENSKGIQAELGILLANLRARKPGSHRADRGSLARPLEFSASHDHTDGPSRHQTVQQQSGILPSSTSHVHYAHETLPVNAGHLQQDSPSSSGVAESVLRTVVSTGNDALNILFEAASRDRNTILDSPCSPVNGVIPQQSRASQPNPINIHGIPSQNLDVLRVWDTCRFVTMGWLTAKDAVMYMDL